MLTLVGYHGPFSLRCLSPVNSNLCFALMGTKAREDRGGTIDKEREREKEKRKKEEKKRLPKPHNIFLPRLS